jgi:hypothetical protein
MTWFQVTRSLNSSYEDESEDKTVVVTVEVESDTLDDLFEVLDEEDFDDEECINFSAQSELYETRKEDFLICDESGKEVWRDDVELRRLSEIGLWE